MIDAVRNAALLAANRPVLVMLSGGRDSVCLLDLSVRIAGSRAVSALHVNYGLRNAADADERHCQALCERLGVALEIRRARRRERGNMQAWAREVRYAAAAELAGEMDIAAGHTATDQLETILYRLASSPSRRALVGMKAREGHLIRPLLHFTRAETGAYCIERGLDWREDETNELDTYARGRVRADLVPALKRIHPAAEQNVLALAELLREEAEVLDELVDGVLAGRSGIEVTRLRELAPALRRLVVQRLADAAVGHPAPGSARRVDEIVALSHGSLDLPHGVRAVVEGGVLRFEPQKRARASAPLYK